MIRKEKLISAVLVSGTLILSGYAWYLYTHPESSGVARQQTEESLANAYIEELLLKEPTVRQLLKPYQRKIQMKVWKKVGKLLLTFDVSSESSEGEVEASSKSESEDTSEEVTGEEIHPKNTSETKTSETKSTTSIPTTEWSDPNYYTRDGITYTPDYAQG